jgi:hypothetical protein
LSHVVFYISGHGFGHASRDIEVINAFIARRPDLRITVRTSAAKWLFDRTVRSAGPAVSVQPLEADTGIVQIDSLHLDADESVRRARGFMRDFPARVDSEADFLQQERASLVIADIPPLGIAAARKADIPAVALGNFTWDWIYSAYRDAGDIVDAMGHAYSCADFALRLPMHGGFATMRRIVDVPFVARRSERSPRETREALGLPLEQRLVLVSFGGYGLEGLNVDALSRLRGYVTLVSSGAPVAGVPKAPLQGRSSGLFPLDERAMYAAGFRYEDLVRAVDVVITKPGYGIIAECLANHTALLYTSRGDFIEYDVLTAAMPRFLRAAFLDHADLFSGAWQPHLDALLAQPPPPEQPRVDGADVAALLLLDMIDGNVT